MDNYIVSARKYRPATFDSVVGQHALTTTLKNAIASGKLAHAYLFCGPRGVGKTTCARIFAKTINCLHPTPQGEACNACESCRAFDEQRSYNIHELDAASNNSVDDIRELIEQVQIPPQVGRYKVFIIDEVHMLSTAAFNAFLKTLEEPPAHAVFILATTEKHKILPTILSRCQTYDFARITVADTVAHLKYVAQHEGVSYEDDALHVIAEKADGGMRDALSIFDQVTSFTEGNITYAKVVEDLNVLDYEQYFAMTDALLKCDIPQAMVRLDKILNKGFEANYFIGGLASHFRNLLMCRDAATLPLLDVSDGARQRYGEQAARCQPKFLYRALKLCNDCDISYRTARNKRLLVELTLIQVGQAAVGDDETGCGRGPTRILKPLFSAAPSPSAAAAPQVAEPRPAYSAPPAAAKAAPAAAAAEPGVQPPPVAAQAGSAFRLQPPQPAAPRVAARPKTLSIRAMREQYEREHRAPAQSADAASAAPAAPAAKLENTFEESDMNYYWYRFAQSLPKEESALCGRMKNMRPVLHPGWVIEVPVDNNFVEEEMRRIHIQLMTYLRSQLRNDYITLKFRMVELGEQHRAYSRVEKFADMLKRSAALRQLHNELHLELA